MKILITGVTGMIGKELGKALNAQGHHIIALTRNKEKALATLPFPADCVVYQDGIIPDEALKDVEVIYNLAGENIGESRWSEERKKRLYDSRIKMTKALVEGARRQEEKKLKKFISVSAIGIYGDRGNEVLNEESRTSHDFLSKICRDWEQESQGLTNDDIQVINPRLGIVLSTQGGALDKLLPLFKMGLGSAVGSGDQWMSWIHISDLVALLIHLLDSKIQGPVNAVAPHPVTNTDFSKSLATKFNKHLFPKVPSFALKLMLGEMSTLVLSSQRVSSYKIENDGLHFKFSHIDEALDELTKNLKNGQEEFVAEQWIPKKPEEVFPFFCDENNLEKITPEFLNFHVVGKSTKDIEESTNIDYRLSLYGIPFHWKTKILQWNPPHKFVDTQLKGPYQYWHHTHELIPVAGGTLLRDTVLYKLPLGLLGKIAAHQKVKSDVNKIFSHRRKFIYQEFHA